VKPDPEVFFKTCPKALREWFDNKDSYKKNVFNIEVLEVKE